MLFDPYGRERTMSKTSSIAHAQRPTMPKRLLASALALSLAGTGLLPGLVCVRAFADEAQADAIQVQGTPDQAASAQDSPDVQDSPDAQAASDAAFEAALERPLTAMLNRDLYGEVDTPMELEFHNRDVQFVDIDAGSTSGRISLSDEHSLYMAAVAQQIDDWAALAFNIFGYADTSNSKLYTDHAGNGFETDFGSGAHYLNLYDALRGGPASVGKKGDDCWRASGLCYTNSLAGAYNALTEAVADSLGGSGHLKGDDFRKHDPIDALSGNTEDQTVIYTNVVQTDRAKGSFKYYCNGFGIAFYDFELHPLSNGEALNTASEGMEGYEYESRTDEKAFTSETTNDTTKDNTLTMTLTRSASESVTSTTSAQSTTQFGQQIGLSVSLERALGEKNKLNVGGSFNASFEEAYSTAYGEGTTLENTVDTSATVSVTLPAHTVSNAVQTSAEEVLNLPYDEPVGITFKVAIYSLNSECYQDDVATAYIGTAGYDQYTFCTLFGDASTGLDTDANESLRMRAIDHVSEPSYEQTYGGVSTYGRYGEDKLIHAIDWGSVLATRSGSAADAGSRVERMSATYPMSVDGAAMKIHGSSVDTVLEDPQPLYPIKSVVVTWQVDRDKDLVVGGEFPLSSVNVTRIQALDYAAVDYYGFVPATGTWKVVDENGNDTNPDGSPYVSDVIEIVDDEVTHEQTVVAKAPGEGRVRYFIPEDTYVDSSGRVSTNADVSAAAYKFTVAEQAVPEFEGTIVLEGAPQVTVGEPANLNGLEGVSVAAYDPTGKEVEPAVQWEAQELSSRGIEVAPDGTILATQPGTFHVRAYMDSVYSEWMEVTVVEAAADAEVPAEPEAPAEPETPAGPTMGALATAIYQYGASLGLISGNPTDGFSQGDYYTMGVLYCAAEYMGYVDADTQARVGGYLNECYGPDQVAAWKQMAMDALVQAGIVPADDGGDAGEGGTPVEPEVPAEPEAPAEPEVPATPDGSTESDAQPGQDANVEEAPVESEVPATDETAPASQLAGVWVSVDAQQHRVELLLDPQSPAAVLTWDRSDGIMGSWYGADAAATITLGSTACPAHLDGDVLWLDYNGATYQFVRGTW